MCSSIDVIRLLVQAYPEGINAKTKKGSTPIALVRGLSVAEPKRLLMESVLLGAEIDPPPKDDLKRRPEDRLILEDIGSVTVGDSKEMNLDLDNDGGSSMSSMDDVSAMMSVSSRSRAGSRDSLGGGVKNLNGSIHSTRGQEQQNYLPTHRAYNNVVSSGGGSISNRSVATAPSDGYALGAGHVVVRKQPLNRMGSMRTADIDVVHSNSSSVNDEDDAESVANSFVSHTPTAVFC